ncbi:DUF1285 domain-containing protein [Rhodalgimonas zhirmunskyi]|uniref:DUF1285 domain-containing protein n=1 Tax=Rhodalgimonas zhirmunskyi TaxID=2964767 RepID=A0AAJ1X4X1_9RHOB|nr:DUF1285 domain-containing protein [Rhodoalgimonas zhirmunskyi]MDQ2093966.1 DUF1285 domain-containing protein [Rhodoalgimonas zhirmunskyi]
MAKAMRGQMNVRPTADGIEAAARAAAKSGRLPPVQDWNPPFCGDLDIHIKRDGTWFYLGTPIGRPELVRLFSTILRKDEDGFFLITPVEKVGISVEDAPFVAVDFTAEGSGQQQKLTFHTNVGDQVVAGPEFPIRVELESQTNEPSPYVLVRDALEALIDRKSFYRLVDIGDMHSVDGEKWFGVWSSGEFFPISPASDLDGS